MRAVYQPVGGGGIGQYGLWTVWSYWSLDDDYVVGLYNDHVSRRDCRDDECAANIYSKTYTEGSDPFECTFGLIVNLVKPCMCEMRHCRQG